MTANGNSISSLVPQGQETNLLVPQSSSSHYIYLDSLINWYMISQWVCETLWESNALMDKKIMGTSEENITVKRNIENYLKAWNRIEN